MKIQNYTTEIASETTIARIEAKLAAIGASHVMKMYGPDKRVSSIIFNMPHGQKSYPVRMPARVEACFEAMWKDHVASHTRWTPETKERIRQQADRTAWRLVQDWINVQCSLIIMKQAEPLEVFLPFVWDGKQTLFERARDGGFKQLPEYTEA